MTYYTLDIIDQKKRLINVIRLHSREAIVVPSGRTPADSFARCPAAKRSRKAFTGDKEADSPRN